MEQLSDLITTDSQTEQNENLSNQNNKEASQENAVINPGNDQKDEDTDRVVSSGGNGLPGNNGSTIQNNGLEDDRGSLNRNVPSLGDPPAESTDAQDGNKQALRLKLETFIPDDGETSKGSILITTNGSGSQECINGKAIGENDKNLWELNSQKESFKVNPKEASSTDDAKSTSKRVHNQNEDVNSEAWLRISDGFSQWIILADGSSYILRGNKRADAKERKREKGLSRVYWITEGLDEDDFTPGPLFYE